MGEAVVHHGATRPAPASLAHRRHDVSGELLDLEQVDGEIVEGVVALVHPVKEGVGAAIGLDGGRDDDVGGAQRLDGPAVACIDRRVDARRELACLSHRAKAIEAADVDTAAPA